MKRSFLTQKGIILSLVLLLGTSGCSKAAKPNPSEGTTPEASSAPVEETTTAYNDWVGKIVSLQEGATIYTKQGNQLEVLGEGYGDVLVSIDEVQGSYLHIKDSDFYVQGQEASLTDRWFTLRNHLIPYNQTVTTQETYTLYNFRDEPQVTLHHSRQYPLYVQASEDDPRVGISFQQGIYYIHQEEVAAIEGDATPQQPGATRLPVLMYHFFFSEAAGETRQDGNDVEVQELDEQLAYLQSQSVATLTMTEVLYFMESRANVPTHSVAITIDDGNPSVYTYAYPEFLKYGMNATLFLIAGWEDPQIPYSFIEMREGGLELQSHGFLMHQGGCSGEGHGGRLLCVDFDEGVQDTRQSFDYVDGGFVYCYPFGDVNANAKAIVQTAGAKLAFTTAPGWISPDLDPLELPRVRVFGGKGMEAFEASLSFE